MIFIYSFITLVMLPAIPGWRAYFVLVTLAMDANLTSGTITKVEFYIGLRYNFTKLVVTALVLG